VDAAYSAAAIVSATMALRIPSALPTRQKANGCATRDGKETAAGSNALCRQFNLLSTKLRAYTKAFALIRTRSVHFGKYFIRKLEFRAYYRPPAGSIIHGKAI